MKERFSAPTQHQKILVVASRPEELSWWTKQKGNQRREFPRLGWWLLFKYYDECSLFQNSSAKCQVAHQFPASDSFCNSSSLLYCKNFCRRNDAAKRRFCGFENGSNCSLWLTDFFCNKLYLSLICCFEHFLSKSLKIKNSSGVDVNFIHRKSFGSDCLLRS